MKKKQGIFRNYNLVFVLMLTVIIFSTNIQAEESEKSDMDSNLDLKTINVKMSNTAGKDMLELRHLSEVMGWNLRYESEHKIIVIYNVNNDTNKANNGNRSDNGSESNNGNSDSSIKKAESSQNSIELSLQEARLNGQKMAITPKIIEGRTYLGFEDIKTIMDITGASRKVNLLTALYLDQKVYKPGQKIGVYIRAYNPTDETVTLRMSSGQKYDLFVDRYNEDSGQFEEIWYWSKDKFFTMALQSAEIKAGQSLEYDLEIEPDLPADSTGEYRLRGIIKTIEKPLELNGERFEILK